MIFYERTGGSHKEYGWVLPTFQLERYIRRESQGMNVHSEVSLQSLHNFNIAWTKIDKNPNGTDEDGWLYPQSWTRDRKKFKVRPKKTLKLRNLSSFLLKYIMDQKRVTIPPLLWEVKRYINLLRISVNNTYMCMYIYIFYLLVY